MNESGSSSHLHKCESTTPNPTKWTTHRQRDKIFHGKNESPWHPRYTGSLHIGVQGYYKSGLDSVLRSHKSHCNGPTSAIRSIHHQHYNRRDNKIWIRWYFRDTFSRHIQVQDCYSGGCESPSHFHTSHCTRSIRSTRSTHHPPNSV